MVPKSRNKTWVRRTSDNSKIYVEEQKTGFRNNFNISDKSRDSSTAH